MAFDNEERKLLEAFNNLDLCRQDNGTAFIAFCNNVLDRDPSNRTALFSISAAIKRKWLAMIERSPDPDVAGVCSSLYWNLLLIEARHHFLDSYLLYLERNRRPKDKFYQPKRKCFIKIGLIQALQDLIDDKLDLLSISMPPGTGKAQPLYSKVLTPDGFVAMGDIKAGDTVISGTGKQSKVLGVYPQGRKSVYEVTFDDGSKCRCSDQHLWKVQTRDDRRRGNKYRVVELKDMLRNLYVEKGKRKNYSVDYIDPHIEFTPQKDLPVHPYLLGVVLGDGGLTSGIKVSLPDDEIRTRVDLLLPAGYELKHVAKDDYSIVRSDGRRKGNRNAVRDAFRSLGLLGKHSYEKHIPRQYLYASYEQRFELLCGLVDTDGYTDRSSIEYTTTSPQLARDVVELVHSLGGYASCTRRHASYKKPSGEKVECHDSYRIIIQFSASGYMPVRLTRKADGCFPQRDVIKRFVTSVEYIGEEECQCIYIDDPSHLYVTDDYIITHNTTLLKFFHSAVAGWYPEGFSLFWTHSDDIARMYYDGVFDIVGNDIEYTWHEIFPDLEITKTNAKMEQFNVGPYKPFPSIQCTSTGAKNAGKVRANQYLIVDDMIGSIEEALNKTQLDKLWTAYTVNAIQRKVPRPDEKPCKEIHCATRWSVNDVIGRLQRAYEDNDRARFIAIPDVDIKTGKSNFNYDVGGFTEKFFAQQALLMDEVSYRCLYKQDPIEREGLLYTEDELRYYQTLPEREPDAILAVCDTKSTGTDWMVMPVLEQYGNDFYLVDCVCDDSTNFARQYKRLANMLVDNNVQMCEFEANAGGSRVAYEVNKIVEGDLGRFCNITSKTNLTNKETRIIVAAPFVKEKVLFKDKEQYTRRSDYGKFMSFLLGYSIAGRNTHDDVPDAMAAFTNFVQKIHRIRPAVIMESPI